jgi:hypothetical protein
VNNMPEVDAMLAERAAAILKFSLNTQAPDMIAPLLAIARRYSMATLLTALLRQTVLVMAMEKRV